MLLSRAERIFFLICAGRYTEVSEETIAKDLMGKPDGRLIDGVDIVTIPAKAGSVLIFPGETHRTPLVDRVNRRVRRVGCLGQTANCRCEHQPFHHTVMIVN